MSISQSLTNALSGLNASARQAQVSSSNIANSLTEGYGVRRLALSAQTIGGQGAGVRVDGVTRSTDPVILAERRTAQAALGADTARASVAARLEASFGTPDDGAGLAARIVAAETALSAAAADPASETRLRAVSTALADVATAFNTTQDDIQAMRERADADIAAQINDLNTNLARVERLNTDIRTARATGQDATALMDQRQVAIDEISELVPLRVFEREGGRVALYSRQGVTLIDGPAAEFSFTPATTIMPQMTFAGGLLGGIGRDGALLDPADPVGGLGGGTLAVSFEARDATLVAAQEQLDALAADMIQRFQDAAVDPSRAPGAPGVMTDAGAAFDPINTTGIAGRVALNAAVDPAQGGSVDPLRNGIGGAAVPVADGAQLNRYLDGLSMGTVVAGGGGAAGLATHAARISSAFGVDRVAAEDAVTFSTARWSALREAELAGGVDSDFEMQMLLRVEQAYAANARVIETVQSMMRALMEI